MFMYAYAGLCMFFIVFFQCGKCCVCLSVIIKKYHFGSFSEHQILL